MSSSSLNYYYRNRERLLEYQRIYRLIQKVNVSALSKQEKNILKESNKPHYKKEIKSIVLTFN